ncbi:MAG: biosynthetic-type acetolactate synthase large subunit [Oscillospiraceae bacterium]|nr:biosynthetic-type acetolactate synthase large subunit [Oscillospiraceae bacterium]
MQRMTVAKAMTECLKAEGITDIFGYPGAAICPFYDELNNTDINHVLVRHEVNAGHAASGYARLTGKPAVCVATSGPGALNLITAIATAYMDSVPMVIITGQVNSDQIGRDVFQEADITGSAEPFVKHSYLLKRPEDTAEVFKKAFYIAGTGRRGPVLIDVPCDVQKAEIDFEYPETVDIRSYRPSSKGNGHQIKRAVSTILEAKKPLIVAGGGLFSGNAAELMRKLSEKLDIPVISTLMGLGAMPTNNERYFGMLGMHGCESAKCAVNNCDTLILLGARLSDRTTAPIMLKKELTVIHIDIDPAEIGKSVAANIPIVGDISLVLGQLLEQLSMLPESNIQKHEEWIQMLESSRSDKGIKPVEKGFVNPKWFIRELNNYLPNRSIVVADVGENQFWTALNIELKNGRFLTSGGMGTMGYSLPAAIGAKMAEPNAEVIAVCGDGSFQMELPELATCVQHDIAVKVIVMRNRYLGMVREFQTNHYGNRLCAVSLDGSPSYTKIADAYGIENMLVDSEETAREGIKKLTGSKKPFLLEVAVPELLETIL